MQYISELEARRLASTYLQEPEQKYIIYNIRERSYKLQDFYHFYFRFSRRESVWSIPIYNIEEIALDNPDEDSITSLIIDAVNDRVDDTLNLRLKRNFTKDDCKVMLNYYFSSKCYLLYYDYYLGRVVLIKERDKSTDFISLVGTRYHFIGNLSDIITKEIDIDQSVLMSFMSIFMIEQTAILSINGFNELNEKVHEYLLPEIERLDEWLDSQRAQENK